MVTRFQSPVIRLLLILAFALLVPPLSSAQLGNGTHEDVEHVSEFWGHRGEVWTPTSRILDASNAGFQAGESTIDELLLKVIGNLKEDFGAIGDGVADDTEALERAVAVLSARRVPGILSIPPGTFRISRMINISAPLVLQGAGQDATTLFFPLPLSVAHGDGSLDSRGWSRWAFRPGFINFVGTDPIEATTLLARVTSDAFRGDVKLEVESTEGFVAGSWVRLTLSDPPADSTHSGSLVSHLYGDEDLPDDASERGIKHLPAGRRNAISFVCRVASVEEGHVRLSQPLPLGVRAEWNPELHRFLPTLTHAGIEQLTIAFPQEPYAEHYKEAGYNALFFFGAAHSWARQLRIVNADYGIGLDHAHFCTVEDVLLSTDFKRDTMSTGCWRGVKGVGCSGHHGIDVSFGASNLITRFDIQTRFVHDISVEWFALGTVFAKGKGEDLNLDMHRAAPYGTLFSDIDCGEGLRMFDSAGAFGRGPHTGARTTFWNLRGSRDRDRLPPQGFGSGLTIISVEGISALPSKERSGRDWVIDPRSGRSLRPRDLHRAMRVSREQRLGGKAMPINIVQAT